MALPASQVTPTMQRAALPTFPNGSASAGIYTLVFRLRRRKDRKILKEHRLINMPMRLATTTEPRTALYYTKAGPVTDTPRTTGVGITVFSLTGHTGFAGVRTQPSPEQQGPFLQTSLVDGAAAIKDLQDMFIAYLFPHDKQGFREITQTSDLVFEFLNLTAPTSEQDRAGRVGWRIHPHRALVDTQREASRPFLYEYSIQFAALAPLDEGVPDFFVDAMADPRTGLPPVVAAMIRVTNDTSPPGTLAPGTADLNAQGTIPAKPPLQPLALAAPPPALFVQPVIDVLHGLMEQGNTIMKAADTFLNENVLIPLARVATETNALKTAVVQFIDGTTNVVRYPLYVKESLLQAVQDIVFNPLDEIEHSVGSLRLAAHDVAHMFDEFTGNHSSSTTDCATATVAGGQNQLTLSINGEPPVTITLGDQPSGPDISQAVQDAIRAAPPQQESNASGYRDFTCTFDGDRYVLRSGTDQSAGARVEVVTPTDPELAPFDASAILGLGLANGGQEQTGTEGAIQAVALLRGLEDACTRLLAFPDFFAEQLDAQDAALASAIPETLPERSQIHGDQHLMQTRITPGDTLQGIANQVGVPWETLALVNRLTYPYILEEPTTLARGRLSSANNWTVADVTQHWATDAWQGQRLDIVAGIGAGQSRRILRNTDTVLVLETAWEILPNDTSDYAIRSASNPVVHSGTVSSSTERELADTSRTMVPGSQRGLMLVMSSGPQAGERRAILDNTTTTYRVGTPWDVPPTPGSVYTLLGPQPSTLRQKVVGELLSVPQPSAQARLPLRTRLQDVSAMTGEQRSLEEQLFGRDLRLDPETKSLVWDGTTGDAVTIAALDNLRQAVIHLINLPLTELEYNPGLGSYIQESLGLTATLPLQIELLASVERTIRQDRRIQRMAGGEVLTQGGTTAIAFTAVAIDGSTVDRVLIR